MLREIREQERKELSTGLQRAKEDAQKQTEEVRTQMEKRIEKQLQTIESLIKDKEALAVKIEEVSKQAKEKEVKSEKER